MIDFKLYRHYIKDKKLKKWAENGAYVEFWHLATYSYMKPHDYFSINICRSEHKVLATADVHSLKELRDAYIDLTTLGFSPSAFSLKGSGTYTLKDVTQEK